MFTENALAQILPTLPADKRREYAPLLQSAAAEFRINNPLREAAFIAQMAHESQNLNRLEENLNYSAPRLRAVWPRRFPTDAIANAYARQPQKLANFVYANRIGNGPPESGDGFRYRGRGFIQLTGRANYREFGRLLGVDLEGNPDMAATPAIAFRIAAAFFESRGCNELADRQQITIMSKRINGDPPVGLQERINLFGKARRILQGRPAGAARGMGVAPPASAPADEGREVPPNLSRGIMPGEEFATAKRGAKKAAAKKAGGGKGSKGGVGKGVAKGTAKKAGAKGAAKGGAGKGAAKKGAAKKGAAKKGGAKGGAKKGAKGGAGKGR